MSFGRKQLEAWLKTIEVSGSIIDAGGFVLPLVPNRVKTWNVTDCKILDINPSADIVCDLNLPHVNMDWNVNNLFCLETMQFLWNPIQALKTFRHYLKRGGNLYISFHFIYPEMKGTDHLRYTKQGVERLLKEADFQIVSITPMEAADSAKLTAFWESQSKVIKHPDEIGWLVHAIKI